MKITLVGPAFPLRGGIAQYLAILHQKLIADGHEVQFVSFIKQFPEWLFPGKTQKETSEEIIDVKPVARFAPMGIRSWWRTYQEIKEFNPDLVIFKFWMPFFAPGYWAVSRWVRKNTAARVVYILDNVIPHEKRIGDKFLTRLACKQVDGFIAQSKVVENDLFLWYPEAKREQVKLSPHPVYDSYKRFDGDLTVARKKLGLSESEKVLLFFGFIREYKGLKLLLEAMPEILRFDKELKLVVCGEFYDDKAPYDKLINDLKIRESVIIRDDYIPNEEVGVYFAAADCVVLPYRSATQSGIIQIAYALDLPVISTDVGGLGEVIIDSTTGYLIPPENPPMIAEAVRKFYQAGGKQHFVPHIIRERGKYSWEGLIQSILSFKEK